MKTQGANTTGGAVETRSTEELKENQTKTKRKKRTRTTDGAEG
jgi:hypothetical protein